MSSLQPIALTMGEPAGVGGEITLKSWLQRQDLNLPYFAIDDANRLQQLADNLGLNVPVKVITAPSQASDIFGNYLPVLHYPLADKQIPGHTNPANSPAVKRSIEMAVSLTQQGKASALVTNPIHKKALYQAGFTFPGHTEFLAELAGISTPPVMMLACDQLRVVPVTVHVSLLEAIRTLTTDDIILKSKIAINDLKNKFGLKSPRLAIAGLNPHAGEDGAMGTEEQDIIQPAIEALKNNGFDVIGPMPPDTMFSEDARKTYDLAICMYHDQALIPLKTLDFHQGVNVTLGLPFIRTSPDHGTAFNIAGQGLASPQSLLAALKMAGRMVQHYSQSETVVSS